MFPVEYIQTISKIYCFIEIFNNCFVPYVFTVQFHCNKARAHIHAYCRLRPTELVLVSTFSSPIRCIIYTFLFVCITKVRFSVYLIK